jgi:SAM-dependent methyltransferase
MNIFLPLKKLKLYLLTHPPFLPAHMGNWIREKYFFKYVHTYIPPEKIHRILDAGCGQGHYSRFVSTMFQSAAITAVDIKSFPEWEKEHPKSITFATRDLVHFSEQQSYDFVYSIDVLEHIRGNEKVLRNFFSALCDGGYLYLHVPCEEDGIFIFPKSWFANFDEWAKDEHVGEQRTLSELKNLMEKIGFDIILARNTFTIFGHFAWEAEFLLHSNGWNRLNILLMPLYRVLTFLDVHFPIGGGDNLILARKLAS